MIPFRNIEPIREIIRESTGLEVSYAYDDLIFPEHTAFIFQIDDKKSDSCFCYFHEDCNDQDMQKISAKLSRAATKQNYDIAIRGRFTLKQVGENIHISFK